MKFASLEDVKTTLEQAVTAENDSLFLQSAVIASAIDEGYSRKVVYTAFSELTRLQARTAYRREKVHRIVNAQGLRNPELSFEIHAICCDLARLDDESTWDTAARWLEVASGTDSKGRGYTTRTLREAMKASGNNPDRDKPVYLFDKQVATFIECDLIRDNITLHLGENIPLLPDDIYGAEVIVTIVRKVESDNLQALANYEGITK